MRLIDAPVIVSRFDKTDSWMLAAANETRNRFADPPKKNQQGANQKDASLKQLAEDIWGIGGRLDMHKDKTRHGFRVLGLVLLNDPQLMLYQDGVVYDLPVGTVYHIDGRSPHAAVDHYGVPAPYKDDYKRGDWMFGFMAWDVHRHEDLGELVHSIPDAMRAYAAGEKRVDVSTTAKPL